MMNNIEDKESTPILLGNDMNVHSMARSFNEAYGKVCQAYISDQLVPTYYSKIVSVEATPGLDKDSVFIGTMLRSVKKRYSDRSKKYLSAVCGDGYAELISQRKQELSEHFICPYIDYSLFERLINKVSLYGVCEECDLPRPKILAVREEMLINGHLERELPFEFPAALKPVNSVEHFSIRFEGGKKAFILGTREEFDLILGRIHEAGYKSEMIIQDFISGDGSNMRMLNAYVGEDHRVRMMCLGHPLLENPTPASIGNYVVITPDYNEKIYQTVKAFSKKIKYTGLVNSDVKCDPRDGEYKLFKVNSRQDRSSFFVILNGLNLVRFVTKDRVFNKPFTETTYGANQSDKAGLWMGVPKRIFLEYVRRNEDEKLVERMIKEGRYGTTVFYEKNRSIKYWPLMKYMFHNYIPGLKEYLHVKED